jgi:hypothetical protein
MDTSSHSEIPTLMQRGPHRASIISDILGYKKELIHVTEEDEWLK